jgi:hypothetical protein
VQTEWVLLKNGELAKLTRMSCGQPLNLTCNDLLSKN